MNENLKEYYSKRAAEYEIIYQKPERQEELQQIKSFLKNELKNFSVYEAACGTGYWTQVISESASSVTAADISDEVIRIAATKNYNCGNVHFKIEDIFTPNMGEMYDAFFGGFIWSHIPLNQLNNFLSACESRVKSGGKIIFMDNNFVEGSSTPLNSSDEEGNTFQIRKLKDGSEYKVLKNFSDKYLFNKIFSSRNINYDYLNLKYFWIIKYKVNQG